MRYRAALAYDGTGYHGFQRQANAASTIQGELEAALERICGQVVSVTGAGRTDAGVHAVGQVVAFDLAWQHTPADLQDALNANLPDDVAVMGVEAAAPGFHPRYDAVSRTYRYCLYSAPVRDPLRNRLAWHLRLAPDTELMNRAAGCLLGERDFSTFGTPPQGENPVRRVAEARWEALPGTDEQHFTITANAFLYKMVRSIVGTLVMVGQGRLSVDEFRDALAACERSRSGPAAPPHGLTLMAVNY